MVVGPARVRVGRPADLVTASLLRSRRMRTYARCIQARSLECPLHVHLDGVLRDGAQGTLAFHALGPPTRTQVAEIAVRTAARVERLLQAQGRSLDPQAQDVDPPQLCFDEPGRAGLAPLRLFVSPEPTSKEADQDDTDPVAVCADHVHARQSYGTDLRQLERLCATSSPAAFQDRLERRADGKLELVLKKSEGRTRRSCLSQKTW